MVNFKVGDIIRNKTNAMFDFEVEEVRPDGSIVARHRLNYMLYVIYAKEIKDYELIKPGRNISPEAPMYVREWLDYDKETKSFTCAHDFKEYVGFTESYKFCTKCDKKG